MTKTLDLSELVLDHPYIASHRLPVLRSWYPRYFYHVAVVVPDPSDTLWGLVTPTDDEILMSAMYLKFTTDRQQYRDKYLQEMAEKAVVDIDPGFVTITLGKSEHLGWQYHKTTWRHGPFPYDRVTRYDTLVELLDKIEEYNSVRWNAFKAEHPEVFG